MRICAISDTHCTHPDLPEADLLIHAGDLTGSGTENAFVQEIDWLKKHQHKYRHGIVYVPGNHDIGLDEETIARKSAAWSRDPYHTYPPRWLPDTPKTIRGFLKDAGIRLVINESFEIEGLRFFGSPYTPTFMDWAFMEAPAQLQRRWDFIPDETQILITHGPPRFVLDLCPNGHVGDQMLAERIQTLPNLKLSIFGHIHESAGETRINGVLYTNVSVLDGNYSRSYFQPIRVINTDDWSVSHFLDEGV